MQTTDFSISEVSDHIAQMTKMAIETSLRKQGKMFEDFFADAQTKMNTAIDERPVMLIQIDNADMVEIQQRPSASLPRLIVNAKIGLYSMLIGPAGCGKTTAAAQLAEALGLQFGSVCLTAGASETWLFGRQTPAGFVEGPFSKIYREGGVFLADEMDAADANLMLSINTALSHSTMLNPMNGEMIQKHKDFVFVGAANTNGKGSTHIYTGRSRLDAATMDRMVVISVDYDSNLEAELCPELPLANLLTQLRSELRSGNLDEFISSRAFSFCYRQFKAGISRQEILDSLIATWGDLACRTAEGRFKSWVKEAPSEKSDFFKLQTRLMRSKKNKGNPHVPNIF